MDEKILIKSQHYNVKKFVSILLVISALLTVGLLIYAAADNYGFYSRCYKDDYVYWCEGHDDGDTFATYDEIRKIHPTLMSYINCCGGLVSSYDFTFSIIPILCGAFLAYLIYFLFSKYELTVTDKRVYGKATFGKRVDLPLDSISAVGTSFLKGIDVGTSSGRIKFKLVKNQDEIHSVMSKLLLERQQKESSRTNISATPTTSSNADELKKFNELLESGVITQEEFDAKKKQLLGL